MTVGTSLSASTIYRVPLLHYKRLVFNGQEAINRGRAQVGPYPGWWLVKKLPVRAIRIGSGSIFVSFFMRVISRVSSSEFEQMGMPFASAGARVGHLEETIQVMKQLFTEETVNFSGKYYTITELKGNIRPVQKPHMPILVAGAGERMLKLAAREADIIAIGSKITAHGVDLTDATLEQKIAWIKEAAGQRFADLELSQTIYDLEITDSEASVSQTGGWFIPKRLLTTEQAVVHLLEQRERYGFSYLQVSAGQMENFAPVLAQLAGK